MEKVKIIATFGRSGYLRHKGEILPVVFDGPSTLEAISEYDAVWAIGQKLVEAVAPAKAKKS